jgi:ribosomal protein S27AE
MKINEHRCIECGSFASHSISDGFNVIFRMEEVYFPCGAVLTASHIDRWQASKFLYRGCRTKTPVYVTPATDGHF